MPSSPVVISYWVQRQLMRVPVVDIVRELFVRLQQRI